VVGTAPPPHQQEESQGQNQGEGVHDPSQSKLKIRCRNFPACNNEACVYHHPTENCKNFPACHYGNKCLYIHPAVQCKFGAFCTRPNCAYTHPRVPGGPNQFYGFGGQKKPYKPHFKNQNVAHQQVDNNAQSGHALNGEDFEMDDQNQGDMGDQ